MIIGRKDLGKFAAISIVTCCAVFVCALFLSYNTDLAAIREESLTEAALAMYRAQVSTGKIVSVITGGCLGITTVILLIFYLKDSIDIHGKELGILKAIGYSDFAVAKPFAIFGLSVFFGCATGFAAAFAYLKPFYRLQNAEGLLPELTPRFHFVLPLALVLLPTLAFTGFAVLYARLKLKAPALDLLRGRQETAARPGRESRKELSFLQSLRRAVLRGKKTLVFFVTFSAFCFSAMVQMSLSMKDLSSGTMASMILVIGLILALLTLLMSLSRVVKGNTKTIAMMRVLGYSQKECGRCLLGCYRPFAYVGFAVGTVYQYLLLRIMVDLVFKEVGDGLIYRFDFPVMLVCLAAFLLLYETAMAVYSGRIRRISVKAVMLE